MGNESNTINSNSHANTKIIAIKEHPHLGSLTQIQFHMQKCNQKTFNLPDTFMMEEISRRLKTRIKKFANNKHVLNVYHIERMQKKDLCVSSCQIKAYLEVQGKSFEEVIRQNLTQKKNFTEEEIYKFIILAVESLIYIQDSGLKNIQLDGESIFLSFTSDKALSEVKILDSTLSTSNSYYKMLNNRQNQLSNSEQELASLYLAPQLLKDLREINYDPYMSPKADIFSLGMLVLEMICLEQMGCYYNYAKCEIDYESLIHRVSKIAYSLQMKTLLAEMLEYDPDERIGFISLREKVSTLFNGQKRQLTNRSKSTKMLKEMLVSSRKSSFSSQKTLNYNSSKNSVEKDRSSFTSSLQTSKESSKQNSSEKYKLVTFANQKKETKINHQKKPSISISANYAEPYQLKNLVKNKINKEKIEEKHKNGMDSSKQQHSRIQFNQPSNLLIEHLNQSQNERKTEQNIKFMKSLEKDMRSFYEECSSSKNINPLKEKVVRQSVLRIQQLKNSKNQKNSSHLKSSQQSGRNTSRFGNSQNFNDLKEMNLLKDGFSLNQRCLVSNHLDFNHLNSECLQSNSRQIAQKLYKPKIEPFKMFETGNKIQIQELLTHKMNKKQENQQTIDMVLKKTMTFNGKQYLKNQTQQQIQNLKSEKLSYSPIEHSCSNSKYQFSSEKIDQNSHTECVERQSINPKVVGHLNKFQKKLHLNDFNAFIEESIPDISEMDNSRTDSNTEKYFPRYYNIVNGKDKQNSKSKINGTSPFAKKANGKKPNLNIQLSESPCQELAERKIDSNFNSKNSKCLNYDNFSNKNNLVSNQIKSKLEGMYQTSKSIEHFSNFNSISPKNQEQSPQVDRLFINVATQGDEDSNNSLNRNTNRVILQDGTIYEGQFSSDRTMHGNGILYSQDHEIIYSGSWKNGKFNGYGTIYNVNYDKNLPVDYRNLDLAQNNWSKYQGQFQNDLKNGFGSIFYSKMQKFSGCLKKNIVDGYGCFYASEGGLISGLWSQNIYKKF